MSREIAVVILEKVSRSRSDGVFPMLLGVGCSLVRGGSSAQISDLQVIGLKNIAVAIPKERTEVMMTESIPAKSEYNVGGIVGAGTSQDGVGHS